MGCRVKSAVNVLIRVAVDDEGHLVVGREPLGRGAWIHLDSETCINDAVVRRGFQRALRREFPDRELAELRVRLVERAVRGEGVGG